MKVINIKELEVSSKLKSKKFKFNKSLIGKFKKMYEYPDFEENFFSRTAQGI